MSRTPETVCFTRRRRRLVWVNICLLVALGLVSYAPRADAQAGGRGARARGDYTMVAGNIQGGSAAALYIIDAANQEMIAVRWNTSQQALDGIGYRDLQADSRASPGR